MADNTIINAGAGGDTIASDDIGGVKHQRVKVEFGVDGVATDVSSANPLPTVGLGNGLVSTVNSSSTVLIVNGIFTGTAEDLTEYGDVRVSVFADQPSAIDGLQLQQSSNGTNWDVIDSYTIPASIGKIFSVGVSARFFRIVYTNGGMLQTAFRLQCKFHKNYSRASSVRPQDGRTNDNDMDEQLAHLLGYNGASWDRLRSSTVNGLVVDVSRIVASVAVTGTFFQTTQPVSAASLPLPAGAATETTLVALNGKMPALGQTTMAASQPVAIASNQTALPVTMQAATLTVTATAAANTAVTATLPAVAGQFHYITGIEIMRTSTAALAGTATLVVTTSNIAGALAWSFGNAMAAGATQRDLTIAFASPLKSSVVNTATTIVMPLPGAAVLWRANVYYYTAV